MEPILYKDQLYSTTDSRGQYSKNSITTCHQNDLIMISNHQGSYLFANCDQNESPVFKVRDSRSESGQIHLRLTVMEVIYPNELFDSENNRANILPAIRQGLAVVKESDSVITFTVNRSQRIEPIELQEINCLCPIRVKSPVRVCGNCEEGIEGCVEVEGQCPTRNIFFLTHKPRNGEVQLNPKTGEWIYRSTENSCERDTFEITVWNFAGGCATQCVHIMCEEDQSPIDVNVTNTPLPVIVTNPVPVFGDFRIVNTPTVTFEQPIEVTTGGAPLEVCIVNTDLSVIAQTVIISPIIDVNVLTLPEVTIASLPAVEISGTPTVTFDQPIEVTTGTTPLAVTVSEAVEVTIASLPAVEISGTPTVTFDQPIEVTTGATPLAVTVSEVVEVTIASLPAVELSGTPTVTFDQPIEVTTGATPLAVTVSEAVEVTIASLPAVEISGTPTVTFDQPVEVEVVNELTIASLPEVTVANELTIASLPEVTVANELTIASLPAVEVSGLVSVTIPEAVTITAADPIEVVVVTAATTEVNLNAYNFYETSLTTLSVPNSSSNVVVYDISRSIDQTLFAHLVSGSSVIGQLIVSPTLNPDYFYPAGISQELSITAPNYPFVSNYFGRYVGVQFTNDTATDATVEVIAQSQGPITEE